MPTKPTSRRRHVAADPAAAAIVRFTLRGGETYRIAYSVGAPAARRLSRSIGLFGGVTQRRLWDGEMASCLEFSLPHGRTVSLVPAQLVDARPASQNERGQWVLARAAAGTERRAAG